MSVDSFKSLFVHFKYHFSKNKKNDMIISLKDISLISCPFCTRRRRRRPNRWSAIIKLGRESTLSHKRKKRDAMLRRDAEGARTLESASRRPNQEGKPTSLSECPVNALSRTENVVLGVRELLTLSLRSAW